MAQPKPPAAGAPPAERLDALLEERFSARPDASLTRQIAEHDRQRAAAAPAPAPQSRLRFLGAIPEPVPRRLREWIPALLAYAGEQGLAMRSLVLQLEVYDVAAYQAQHGAIAGQMRLPASSYHFNALYRAYTVRLVLPPRLASLEDLLASLRALLTRLYGDIWLQEEVFSLEAYREDVAPAAAEPTVGMAEKLLLLAELGLASPALERALEAHGAERGLSFRRAPGSVRKSFFADLERRIEEEQLLPAQASLVDAVFADYLARLRQDLPGAVRELVAATEKLNAQTTFLPPDELADYQRLRQENPTHYLRAAKLRLEFALEGVAAVVEEYAALQPGAAGPTPLSEERIQGLLQQLEIQHLARPYLVQGARLGPELERKRKAFPLEVHALIQRLPPAPDVQQLFKSVSQRLRNSLHQRLYQGLLLLRQGLQARVQGRGDAYLAGSAGASLKALAANLRFRQPLLRSHFARLGVVLDLVEAHASPGKRPRLSQQGLTRGWGQFIAHALLAGFLGGRGLPGFNPARYWAAVEASLARAVSQTVGPSHLAYLLRRYHVLTGQPDLRHLAELLQHPPGTLRFVVQRALEPPRDAGQVKDNRLSQLQEWAQALQRARQESLQNAIVAAQGGIPIPSRRAP